LGSLPQIPKATNEGIPQLDVAQTWMTAKWSELKNAYIIFHQNCWESFLHYVGELWVEWNSTRKIMDRVQPDDEFVPQPRINKFSPTIDSIVSNFNTVPEVEAVVKSDLSGDIRAHGIAEICSTLGEHFLRTNGLKGDYKSQSDKAGIAAQIFVLCGNVLTCVYPEQSGTFDRQEMEDGQLVSWKCYVCDLTQETPQAPERCPNCGGPLATKPVQRMVPMIDPLTGKPKVTSIPEYRVCCELGNPLYFFPRPGSTGMHDNPYMLYAIRMPLDYIHYRWQQDAKGQPFEAEADQEFSDGYNVTFEHALSYYYTGFSNSSLGSKDSCLVKFAYVEPGKVKDFPDGMYAVEINKKLVEFYTWADFFVEHPLTRACYAPVPTLFWARSVAFDLVNIDREVITYESLIKLHAMTSAVDPVVIDENTVVSEITGRADKTIKWRSLGPGSAAPHRMQHGTLDDGVYKKLDQLYAEYEHISGSVKVYRGEQPGSVTAASAIADLKDQAEQSFSRPVSSWNNLWSETVRKGVKTMQKRLTPEQITKIIGPDHASKIEDFLFCDLDSTVDWISTGMGLPRTRTQRKQEMLELFDRGALDVNDVNVKEQIFELFGHTGMMKQFNADATRARYENKMMQQGQPATMMPEIEDIAVHFAEHAQAIKSLEFEHWDPIAKQLLIEHAILTKQALLEMQMAAAPPGDKGDKKANSQNGPSTSGPAGAGNGAPAGPAAQG
jgi:hypothetical protein